MIVIVVHIFCFPRRAETVQLNRGVHSQNHKRLAYIVLNTTNSKLHQDLMTEMFILSYYMEYSKAHLRLKGSHFCYCTAFDFQLSFFAEFNPK